MAATTQSQRNQTHGLQVVHHLRVDVIAGKQAD
jgi:hypothetical protein